MGGNEESEDCWLHKLSNLKTSCFVEVFYILLTQRLVRKVINDETNRVTYCSVTVGIYCL